MFKNAIVRKPGASLVYGISGSDLGKPDFALARIQHEKYVRALESCGVLVTVMEAADAYPDSVFIEDTAVLTAHGAIITRPGADSRFGEEESVAEVLTNFYQDIVRIESPGTVDGGDVMQVEDHFYIGLSNRTNQAGADQFIAILNKIDYGGSVVPLKEVLHLKTGINYIGNQTLLTAGEFIDHSKFAQYKKIMVLPEEAYAANSLRVNDTVIVPAGFPDTAAKIEQEGFNIMTLDLSEFRKLDGGLSCLSLRF